MNNPKKLNNQSLIKKVLKESKIKARVKNDKNQ